MARVVLVLLMLSVIISMEFVHDDSLKNTDYDDSFWESRDAVGNTYSSLVYAALALYLMRRPSGSRPLGHASEIVVLFWFAYLSFRYHMTTSRWHGALDLWCVVYLCMSCLSRYRYDSDRDSVLFTWIAMVPLLIEAALDLPDGGHVVVDNLGIIGVLVYLLLSYSVGLWRQFSAFALAFTFKAGDMAMARAGKHTLSPVNGTSLFHMLTGLAMYYHYKVMFEAAPAVDELVEEFGAGYEKTERWQALKSGQVKPTPREKVLLKL